MGIVLINFAHYHERAYVLLGLGAAGFISGTAGIAVKGVNVKESLSYGVIAAGAIMPVNLTSN